MITESQILNEWIAKAVEQSLLQEWRETLIRMLKRKFRGQVTDDVVATINQQSNLTMLQTWFDETMNALLIPTSPPSCARDATECR